ncbi:CDP-diacylglycerol--glycerol-3-phosphate 3-phosphatidyltransferase [Chlamydiota bacterium]
MNIANKLTLLRIILIPIMLYLSLQRNLFLFLTGFTIAVIIGFTDLLDGYLARKYKIITDFGKFLDPVADKIFIISLLLLAVNKQYIPVWFFMIILIREFFITDLRLFALKNDQEIRVNYLGKRKTMFQFILLFVIGIIRTCDLYLQLTPSQSVTKNIYITLILYTFISITTFYTVASMLSYLWKNRTLIADI